MRNDRAMPLTTNGYWCNARPLLVLANMVRCATGDAQKYSGRSMESLIDVR